MNRRKKLVIGLVCTATLVLLILGIVFAVKKTTQKAVTVVPVSEINWGYWGNDVNISGTVTSNASQEIHLNDKQIVSEVYVQEGDVVEIGTPLLSFDMTMTSLNLESEVLNKTGLEIQKQGLEGEISRLQRQTPVSSRTSHASAYSSDSNPNAMITLTETNEPSKPGTSTEPGTPSDPDTPSEPGTPSNPEDPSNPDSPDVPDTPSEPGTPSDPEDPSNPDSPDVPNDPSNPDAPSVIPPAGQLPAYACIDENSQYLGDGTKEHPRCYLAMDSDEHQVQLTGTFLNHVRENRICFYVLLFADNTMQNELLASIFINGAMLNEHDAEKTYALSLYPTESVIEEPNDTPDDGILPEDPGIDIFVPDGYTREELNAMIKEKQRELRSIDLDIRECELRIAQIENSLKDQEIKSTVNGIVKSVGDPAKGEINGEAFLIVESTEGLYVQGSLSELMLEDIQAGHILYGTSWETGMSFEAEIQEISPYPLDGNNYDGYGNSNASYYPFTAYIQNGEGLRNNEYVGFTTTIDTNTSLDNSDSIYTEKMFVREENGISYVYIADENNRLKKQVVQVKHIDGYTIQILSGLSVNDRITFPYGKNIKEGAPVRDGSLEDLYS